MTRYVLLLLAVLISFRGTAQHRPDSLRTYRDYFPDTVRFTHQPVVYLDPNENARLRADNRRLQENVNRIRENTAGSRIVAFAAVLGLVATILLR